jgi:hypothetical protein
LTLENLLGNVATIILVLKISRYFYMKKSVVEGVIGVDQNQMI